MNHLLLNHLLLTAALLTFSLTAAIPAAQAADNMAKTAIEFLSSLSTDQLDSATFSFDNEEERHRWHFIPPEMFQRGGIAFKDMSDTQHAHARLLLESGLSQRGMMTVDDIILLEGILQSMQQGPFARDPQQYYLAVFGAPEPGANWAWRLEGHHLSLHFTVVAGEATVSSPTFFGANPAVVREGPHEGMRALGDREDAGRALVEALSEDQLSLAILSAETPRDIITGADFPIDPLSPEGIRADTLDDAQHALLRDLISVYTAAMKPEIAVLRWEKIEDDGLDTVSFAWAGSLDVGEAHYYRVQGPSFLIEYDNTQDNANHIHSVWRDFEGDFGQDLLREHYNHSH